MSTASHSSRPPTLQLPSLHLGSFHGLSIESFHTSGSPSPSPTPTADPLDQYRDAPTDEAGAAAAQSTAPSAPPTPAHPPARQPSERELARTRSKPKGPVPPPLQHTASMSSAASAQPAPSPLSTSQTPDSPSFSPDPDSTSPTWAPLNVPSGPRQPRRALQPSLTIQTAAPLTPTSDQQKFDLSPHLRDSPTVARRRTVIENSSKQASPVRVTRETGTWTPPHEPEPAMAMPEPRLSRVGSPARAAGAAAARPAAASLQSTPSRKSKESATASAASGTLRDSPPSRQSPSKRRTLPRPPSDRAEPSQPASRPSSRPNSRGNPQPLYTREVTAEPQPMSRLPRNNSNSPEKAFTFPRPAAAARPEVGYQSSSVPAAAPSHRQQPSASNMPAIAGLADAGPYPTPSPSRTPIGLGRPTQGPTYVPPEEICLECAMRDRDLADVHVSGEGVWARASDADWDELGLRERELVGSETGSAESADSRLEGSRVDGGLREVRRRQRDTLVAQVGWRGFSWEEGRDGEGLPPGFRGMHGGPLSEDAIRAVMQKFPSSSALRYHRLETYLKHQHRLILEIRAEATRAGRFAEPEEPKYDSSSGSSHDPVGSASYSPSAGPSRSPIPPVHAIVPRMPSQLSTRSYQPMQRPSTQFIPDREPTLTVPRTPGQPRRPSHGKGVSSPDVLQRFPQGSFDPAAAAAAAADEDLWSPASPAESGLRPFSFAVRAGAVREGSEGHGRRSIFGRFGGSVTSLFGGSHGGSGSMMDMHGIVDHPRAVSMASPSRPAFFASGPRPQSSFTEQRSISSSRLAQLSLDDEPKKKGFKGLLAKMKPKSRKPSGSNLPGDYEGGDAYEPRPAFASGRGNASGRGRGQDDALAPPPNMAFLVNRGKRDRSDSGSINSAATDKSLSPQMPFTNMRSVSAPLAGSSGSSASVSPTSSRNVGLRRESYASAGTGRPSVDDRRGSAMEMLAARDRDEYAYPQPYGARPHAKTQTDSTFSASPALETPPPMHMGVGPGSGYFAPGTGPAYGAASAKGPASPPQRYSTADAAPLSPNRFKNLPPLPPPRDPSADSLRARSGAMADPLDFSLRGTVYDAPGNPGGAGKGPYGAYGAYSAYAGAPGSQPSPYRATSGYGSSSALPALGPAFGSAGGGGGGGSGGGYGAAASPAPVRYALRASYDQGESRARIDRGQGAPRPGQGGAPSPRLAQSMYAQTPDAYARDAERARKKPGIKALFAKGR